MFDIGWSELLVIAVVAIIVVGPKDLPGMLRAFGKTMNQVRRTANDFKRQFNDALREAETESGLKDTTDQLKSIGSINPMADVKEGLNELKKDINVVDGDTGAAVTASGGEADAAVSADNKADKKAVKKPADASNSADDSSTGPKKPAKRVKSGSDAA